MKRLLLVSSFSFLTSVLLAQNVNIPDAAFKAALVADHTINTNMDMEIQVAEASAYAGTIELASAGISNLTGIEAFTNVTLIDVGGNNLTTIDVSQNTQITRIDVGENNLTTIDLSSNTLLEIIDVANMNLGSLDVTSNTALTSMNASAAGLNTVNLGSLPNLSVLNLTDNNLNSVDLSGLPLLHTFVIEGNNLTSLDLTNNPQVSLVDAQENNLSTIDLTGSPAISFLQVAGNSLTELDLSQNTALTQLRVADNDISFLDLRNNTQLAIVFLSENDLSYLDVSQNTLITDLRVQDNQLLSLDLRNNSSLEKLFAHDNDLIYLNVQNGNNNNVTFFDAQNNPDLKCITVDDVAFAQANFTMIDSGSGFGLDCAKDKFDCPTITEIQAAELTTGFYRVTHATDPVEINTGSILFYKTDEDRYGKMLIRKIEPIANYRVTIDYVTYNNDGTVFSSGDGLVIRGTFGADLDDGTESGAGEDRDFNWSRNNTTNTTFFTNGGTFAIFSGYINIPDANFKAGLVGNASINTDGDAEISCAEAKAFSNTIGIDNAGITDATGIESFANIQNLFLRNNDISSIDITNNTLIRNLDLQGNQLTTLDLTKNTALVDIFVASNQLNALDVSQNTSVTRIIASINNLSALDVSANTALLTLTVFQNQLTALDVSNNTSLKNLSAETNMLSSIDLSANTDLLDIRLAHNEFSTIDLSNNGLLTTVVVNNNPNLAGLDVANGNNSAISTFIAVNNPLLECIKVSDVAYAQANWTNIPSGSSFSTSCLSSETDITAFSFTEQLAPATINPTDHTVAIEVVTDTDVSSLVPTISLSAGAIVDPLSGVANDFSSAATYTVTAEDGVTTQPWTVTISVNNSPTDITLDNAAIEENNSVDDVIGNLSSTDVNSGDSHTYMLVAGTGDTDNASFNISGSELRASEAFDFETKSSYSIRVQTDDGNGGTFEKSFTISITDFDERADQVITIEPIADKPSTADPFDVVASSDAILPLTFEVSGPATIDGATITLTGAGTVTVTANQAGDDNFKPASAETSFTVIDCSSLELAIATTTVTCNGGTDGAVDLTVSGGLAPYTFSWNNQVTTEDQTGLGAGDYTVTVTDANGCTKSATATVSEPDALQIAATTAAATDIAGNGAIDVTVTGGTAPYTYLWSNDETTEDLTGLFSGIYTLTVTDANGCEAIEEITVDGITAIDDFLNQEVKAYPNPVGNTLNIQIGTNLSGSWSLLDFSGKEIQSGSLRSELEIGMADRQQGVYVLRIQSDQGTVTRKIIKQ